MSGNSCSCHFLFLHSALQVNNWYCNQINAMSCRKIPLSKSTETRLLNWSALFSTTVSYCWLHLFWSQSKISSFLGTRFWLIDCLTNFLEVGTWTKKMVDWLHGCLKARQRGKVNFCQLLGEKLTRADKDGQRNTMHTILRYLALCSLQMVFYFIFALFFFVNLAFIFCCLQYISFNLALLVLVVLVYCFLFCFWWVSSICHHMRLLFLFTPLLLSYYVCDLWINFVHTISLKKLFRMPILI